MSIKKEEIVKNNETLDAEQEANLKKLLNVLNVLRKAYGKPMVITSGFRSKADQIRIYKAKGITDEKKIPMGSQHLKCAAADIYDPDQEFWEFCMERHDLIDQLDIFFEAKSATPNWTHLQLYPFKSYKKGGTRIFNP